MADAANVLSDRDIAATNVRPAFEASLRFGATEDEIASVVGWRRVDFEAEEAIVSSDSTYRHLELMYQKANYAQFVLAATALHTPSSLGVVGLASKTTATVGEAMACHQRFQHLTNRTAHYSTTLEAGHLTLTEKRAGKPRLGSLLMSDYTMFIALHLVRAVAQQPPLVLGMQSRRDSVPEVERRAYQEFLGAAIQLGAPEAQLILDESVAAARVVTADTELAAYFQAILERAAPFASDDTGLLGEVQVALRDHLPHGTTTAKHIASTLGLGQRTLQRRLADLGHSFADVLESTRGTLAKGYLRDPALSLAEIAYLLGYVEQASFFRAFRRWHDQTPTEFRQGLPSS